MTHVLIAIGFAILGAVLVGFGIWIGRHSNVDAAVNKRLSWEMRSAPLRDSVAADEAEGRHHA